MNTYQNYNAQRVSNLDNFGINNSNDGNYSRSQNVLNQSSIDSGNMFFPNNNFKKAGSWECNVCHKIFKERKGFYQHINSNTHEPIKYSCSQCGKGFASLGALALHNEQASHAHLTNRVESQVPTQPSQILPSKLPPSQGLQATSGNYYPYPSAMSEGRFGGANQFRSNGYQNNARGGSIQHPPIQSEFYGGGISPMNAHVQGNRNNYQSIPAPNGKYNSFQANPYTAQHMQTNVSKTMPSTLVKDAHFQRDGIFIQVYGHLDHPSRIGAFSWVSGDEASAIFLADDVVTFADCPFTLEQLEYQAIVHALKAALIKSVKTITLQSSSEAVLSHLMKNKQNHHQMFTDNRDHVLEVYRNEIVSMFPMFELIRFELISTDRNTFCQMMCKGAIENLIRSKNDKFYAESQGLVTSVANTSQGSNVYFVDSTGHQAAKPHAAMTNSSQFSNNYSPFPTAGAQGLQSKVDSSVFSFASSSLWSGSGVGADLFTPRSEEFTFLDEAPPGLISKEMSDAASVFHRQY